MRRLVAILIAIPASLAFFWLVVMKIVSRVAASFGVSGPCPSALGWLVDNPFRRRRVAPLLDRVGIRPGEWVLELGPGPGAFTVEAARRVGPGGRLIVVDIQPGMIAQVEARVRRAGFTNVEWHVADACSLPLAAASIDRAFLITVLGEIPDPARALAELHRVLAPGGVLSVGEAFMAPDYAFPLETVRRVDAAGFRLAERHGNLWDYTLNFRSAQVEALAVETYLAPLYWRAMESQRPDAMIRDEKAEALVTQMNPDIDWVRQIPMNALLNAMRMTVTREMDRSARDFLSRHPEAIVVHIGCGLDSRYERVDNGRVEWYDLDLPDVIARRRKFIGEESERYHLLACSVLEDAWLNAVKALAPRPILFLAETVFVYFTEAQVKTLLLTLRDHFPGAELVFDGWRPYEVWVGNRYLSKTQFAGLMHWGLWRGQEIERWGGAGPNGASIRLLDEWGFFDQPEPRLASFRWLAPIFRLFKPIRIFHFRLGEATG